MSLETEISNTLQAIFNEAFADDNLTISLTEKVLPDDWGRNRIWRYSMTGASYLPETVIVKISKIGHGHIFHEWASLQFLNQFPDLDNLVPRLYGGDRSLEVLVMEDLGDVRNRHALSLILEGDDAQVARTALVAHARQMGDLHRITAHHEAKYLAVRQQFPETQRLVEKDQFDTHFQWFRAMLARFGVDVPQNLDEELEDIAIRLHNPDAIRAYTRGDVCPSNVAYQDNKTRFYDFEMGGYRNVFLSAVYFRLSHVSCLNGSVIPIDVQAEAEKAYFETMHTLMPDVGQYQSDYAGSAIALLIWMMSRYLEKQDRPRHLMTRHQRVWAGLDLYLNNPLFCEPYPAVTQSLKALRDVLDSQWSDDIKTMTIFPAFEKS
ncbi:MAG: hypothetical protein AAF846_24190 [Chloroflexota bacterium]